MSGHGEMDSVNASICVHAQPAVPAAQRETHSADGCHVHVYVCVVVVMVSGVVVPTR